MNLAQELEPEVPKEEVAAAEAEIQQAEQAPKAEEKPIEEKVKEEKVVPLAALHEERERRKEISRQFEAHRLEQAKRDAVLNDRLNQLFEQQKGKAQQRQIPEYAADPLENLNGRLSEQGETLRRLAESQQQSTVQQQRAQQQQQFIANLQSELVKDEARFAQETLDYPEAAKFLQEARFAELKALGADQQQIIRAMQQDVLGLALSCQQRGVSPAEAAYELAKVKGYKGKAVSAEKKMETLQKGVEAAKGLTGGAVSGKPTMEQIAGMSDEEFAKLKADLKKSGQRLSDAL